MSLTSPFFSPATAKRLQKVRSPCSPGVLPLGPLLIPLPSLRVAHPCAQELHKLTEAGYSYNQPAEAIIVVGVNCTHNGVPVTRQVGFDCTKQYPFKPPVVRLIEPFVHPLVDESSGLLRTEGPIQLDDEDLEAVATESEPSEPSM